MTDLKYERFIVKMSVEQKVKLITSTELYKSSSVGNLDFPTFTIQSQPFDETCKDVRVTQFPCDAALAASWNSDLVNDVYAAIGEECRAVNPCAYFDCTDDISAEKFTSQYFVLAKFLAEKTAGLRRSNAYVNFRGVETDDESEAFLRRNVRDAILSTAQPGSFIFKDPAEAEYIKRRFKFGELVFGEASTVDEALDFLYGGASFLFVTEEVQDALINKLTTLTLAYKQAHAKFVNDQMPESNFARLVRNFKIFDMEIIDRACNDIITVVYDMQTAREDSEERFRSLRGGTNARFDEIGHRDLAITAARQSAVLIKNDNQVLPLKSNLRIALMGAYAKEYKYQRSYFNTRATEDKPAFEAINDYGLKTTGYAAGYAMGEPSRSDLIDRASALCAESDVVLVYLSVEKGGDRLPEEQLALLRLIAGKNVKVVAVVACYGNIDMSFIDNCDAVILTYAAGQGGAVASLDIITGEVCPSGKLAAPAGAYTSAGFREVFPVGYGLSYTRFEYSNLKVNETGVSFTVRNIGEFDGYAVPMLFVKKKNTKSVFAEKLLRGYAKVFVAKGDATRVKIPFDDVTFGQYDEDNNYFVEGGLYTVTVGENLTDEKLSGMLMLKKYEEKLTFRNREIEKTDDGRAVSFDETGMPRSAVAARRKLPFALKVTLAVMLAVYVDAVIALFLFGNIISAPGATLYIVLGAVAAVVNILVVVFVCIAASHRKNEKYLHANTVLTDMIDNVDEFTEIAKVKYKTPVDEPKEEELSEEKRAEEEEAKEIAATYEVKFDEVDTAELARADKVSFAELCENLRAYARSKGINIEMTSARAFVAALVSCKLVFLTSKNAELLPQFLGILNDYYGNESRICASDEWSTLSDILWSRGEDDSTFVLSPFSNAVYGAHKNPDRQCAVILENVNLSNLGSYFFSFLEYANHPTENYVISFNEETSFSLPDNLTYILATDSPLDIIPTEILNASLVIDVILSRAEGAAAEEVEPKVVSHEDFKLLLSEVKEVDFVSERIWKKVDSLAETLNATEKFAIGNKNIIQMESFTSVMIDCGADEPEAVTNMFLSKLAYILKNTRAYRQDGGDKAVFAIIEKLFADEELTKIKRVLAKPVRVQPQTEGATPEQSEEEDGAADAEAVGQTEQPEQPAEGGETETAEGGEQPEQPEQSGQSDEGWEDGV